MEINPLPAFLVGALMVALIAYFVVLSQRKRLNDIEAERQRLEAVAVKAREMLVDVEHPSGVSLRIANSPLRLGRTPGGVKGPPPVLGADTAAVLRRMIGLSDEEIGRLRADEVVVSVVGMPSFSIISRRVCSSFATFSCWRMWLQTGADRTKVMTQ